MMIPETNRLKLESFFLWEHIDPGSSLTENRRLSFAPPPLCKITAFFGKQRVIGVVSLPVDKWLEFVEWSVEIAALQYKEIYYKYASHFFCNVNHTRKAS